MKIEIELTKEVAEDYIFMIDCKRACGDLRPDINGVDEVCIKVAQKIAREMHQQAAQQNAATDPNSARNAS